VSRKTTGSTVGIGCRVSVGKGTFVGFDVGSTAGSAGELPHAVRRSRMVMMSNGNVYFILISLK
jgi:hypothetical protein